MPEIPPNDQEPVFPEAAKELSDKLKTIYPSFMDQMKASVSKNGQFFAELGEKPTTPDAPDNRAYILKAKQKDFDTDPKGFYVGIIRSGPVRIDGFDARVVENNLFSPEAIKRNLENSQKFGYDSKTSKINAGLIHPLSLSNNTMNDDVLEKAMKESLEISRAEKKIADDREASNRQREEKANADRKATQDRVESERIQRMQKNISRVEGLGKLLTQSPPPGEGPAAPPPPTPPSDPGV